MVELISVHIPKTAGTAFQKTLLHVYGSEQVLLDYPPDRVYRPGEPIADSIKVIHGHFALKKYRNHFPEAYRIVWLRHPVFRLISEYFYALTIHDTKNVAHAELFEKNLDIVGFAKLPSMQNHMQRWLQEIELEDLYFVGLQEFYPQDIDDLKSLLGWPAVPNLVNNKNLHPDYIKELREMLANSALMNQLAILNQKDMRLYQQALLLRARRRGESHLIQPTLAEYNRLSEIF